MTKMAKSADGLTFADFIENQAPADNDRSTLPRRLGVLQYFKTNYWDEYISDTYNVIRDRDLTVWKAMLASGAHDVKKPDNINANNEAVATVWALQTAEFKEKVERERDDARKALEEAAKRSPSASGNVLTPEEYQTYAVSLFGFGYRTNLYKRL